VTLAVVALAAALNVSAVTCRPVDCLWSAPGFSPGSSSSTVLDLPCPLFQATAPPIPGLYPVTLTLRCTYNPAQQSSKTLSVTVLDRNAIFSDGFEDGSASRWSRRHP